MQLRYITITFEIIIDIGKLIDKRQKTKNS